MEMKNRSELKCMELCVKLFRVMGFWPFWKRRNQRSERLYFCYVAFMMTLQGSFSLILGCGLILHYKSWMSVDEAVEEIVVFATGFIVFCKTILFFMNFGKFQKFIDLLKIDLNEKEIRDEEENEMIKNCVRHERTLTKVYLSFGYSITIMYVLALGTQMLSSDTSSRYVLPLKYPFEPKGFLYFVTYVHQLIAMAIIGHFGTLMDSCFSCLAYYICGHLQILKMRISKDGGKITRNFVFYHNKIIKMVNKLESIFGLILFVEMSTNSFLMCVGLKQLTQTKKIKILHYTKSLIYVTIKLGQMFSYCWFGHEIFQRSFSISYETYFEFRQGFCNKKDGGDLTTVMLRAQKPLQIKGGYLLKAYLPTLTTVLRSAYSFFTILKTLEERN